MSPHIGRSDRSIDDALAEMTSAGFDCAGIHPPSSLEKRPIAGLRSGCADIPTILLSCTSSSIPDRENSVAHCRERPVMPDSIYVNEGIRNPGGPTFSDCFWAAGES